MTLKNFLRIQRWRIEIKIYVKKERKYLGQINLQIGASKEQKRINGTEIMIKEMFLIYKDIHIKIKIAYNGSEKAN